MTKIRLTRLFGFEAAHALMNYDGPCRNIHGHSYKLAVTVAGEPMDDISSPKNGMLMDFSILKSIVKMHVVDVYDHALILNRQTPLPEVDKYKDIFSKVILLPYQPTCENILIDFAAKLTQQLPGNISLHSLKLHETENSWAEWYNEDNR